MTRTQILIPINQSDYSRQILPHVQKLLPAASSHLRLFYITKPPKGIGLTSPDYRPDYRLFPSGVPLVIEDHPIYPIQQEESIKAAVYTDLLPTINPLKQLGYEVSLEVDFGEDTVEAIVQAIEREQIDLVAMSTRARDGVLRFFFGDIANEVLRRVDIPALLIHPHVE